MNSMAAPELLLTPSQMKKADAFAVSSGTPSLTLMRNAGHATAEAAAAMVPLGSRVIVLIGPGQNGGDGIVAAARLLACGYDVSLCLLGRRDALREDAAIVALDWPHGSLRPEDADFAKADLIVDALFGGGLSRDIDGVAKALIERLNLSGRPVLAVDLPSGIDGETGAVRGIAVKATRTVTFAARKPGHFLLLGRAFCGEVILADIGVGPDDLRGSGARLYANSPPLWETVFPRLDLASHKYDRGHVLVASGGATRTGAARLAARAALRIGAGLVTVASPPEALGVNAAQLTAIMLRGYDGAEGLHGILADQRLNALVIGPALGVTAATRAMVAVAAQARRRLVLDADALTSFEGLASELHQGFRSAPTVITPHDGEFKRLFKGHPDILDPPSKVERARRAAAYLGAVTVLKGADTVIAAPDGRAAINANGTPYLGTAGSGDVLCGIIAGLMAQQLPAFEAAAAGVWIHAEAGATFGAGLISEDLPELIPEVLQALLS
jgi:hydroxyethylthiazole kinase-like uncharacterized protein yjeF